MDNNCLITRLKSSVTNTTLPRFGYLNFRVPANVAQDKNWAYRYDAPFVDSMKIISGDGHFEYAGVDEGGELAIEAGAAKTFKIVTETACVVSIPFPYDMKCKKLVMPYCTVDASAVEWFFREKPQDAGAGGTGFDDFVFNISGDLDLTGTHVIGTAIAQSNLALYGTEVHGDVTEMLKELSDKDPNVYSTACSRLFRNNVTADLSKFNVTGVYFIWGMADVTWEGSRTASFILGMSDFNFGDYLDAMLIDQARLQENPSSEPLDCRIRVKGNRTSASDAAVATLKSKGIEVTINGEPL